jgi:hypothetical protein
VVSLANVVSPCFKIYIIFIYKVHYHPNQVISQCLTVCCLLFMNETIITEMGIFSRGTVELEVHHVVGYSSPHW